jgi:hypothetical protein
VAFQQDAEVTLTAMRKVTAIYLFITFHRGRLLALQKNYNKILSYIICEVPQNFNTISQPPEKG